MCISHPRAICGRNRAKLENLKAVHGVPSDVEIIVADARDAAAIDQFVSRTKVVCALAGPFVRYSDLVVEACARHGTHYVDICGEPEWYAAVYLSYQMLLTLSKSNNEFNVNTSHTQSMLQGSVMH